jgi:hypothetical protein
MIMLMFAQVLTAFLMFAHFFFFFFFFYFRDVKKLPRENLEVLLELEGGFPSPISTNKDDINVGCGICYSFRFEGQVPDQLCSHAKCQQPFHRACLYEVLAPVMFA